MGAPKPARAPAGARTLLFTTSYPFNEDYALKYGFDVLLRRGFSPRILNLTRFLLPEEAGRRLYGGQPLPPVLGVEQTRVASLAEFEEIVRRTEGWKLVVLASFATFPLLRAIRRAGAEYLELFTNLMPTPTPGTGRRLATVARKLLLRPDQFLGETIAKRVPRSWLGVPHPRFVVRGSQAAPKDFPAKTVQIQAHSFDYDRMLRNREVPRHPKAPAGDYFVHLECPPWDCHDYRVLGLKAAVTKEEYGRVINRFFDFVERETGKPVVVSAHPKHGSDDDVYGGRPFLYGTEPLVRHASGVFCHYSGALKFAVIHQRPVRFLTSRRLEPDAYFQMNLRAYLEGFQERACPIDDESDWRSLLGRGLFHRDPAAYEEYLLRYIVARPQERLLWELIADELEAWRPG